MPPSASSSTTSSPSPSSNKPSTTPITTTPNYNSSDANAYDSQAFANRTPSTKTADHGGKLILATTILAANLTVIILLAVAVAYLCKKVLSKTPTTNEGTVEMHDVDLTTEL